MLKLPAELYRELIVQSERDKPVETCGYLAGIENEVKMIIPMTNIDNSPEHFSFDPAEQFQVLKSVRAKGYRLTGVYHSHPASPARLSQEDLRLANDPNMFYLIVSLLDAEPVIRAFKVIAKEISEISIQIEGDLH